jgi:hypothetical protein
MRPEKEFVHRNFGWNFRPDHQMEPALGATTFHPTFTLLCPFVSSFKSAKFLLVFFYFAAQQAFRRPAVLLREFGQFKEFRGQIVFAKSPFRLMIHKNFCLARLLC